MLISILSIVIILASILLILVVYVQNPKGGGLSTDFGAAHQIGGVQKTNDFIDKTTWTLAGLIAVLSIVLTLQMKTDEVVPPTPEEQQEQEGGQTPQNGNTAPAGNQTGGQNGGQPAGQ